MGAVEVVEAYPYPASLDGGDDDPRLVALEAFDGFLTLNWVLLSEDQGAVRKPLGEQVERVSEAHKDRHGLTSFQQVVSHLGKTWNLEVF